jgi:hypothetical protein
MIEQQWPTAELDDIARLRVLAEAVPGAAIEERVIDAPYDRVWPLVTDLERNVARFDTDVHRIRMIRRDGDRIIFWGIASWRWLWVPARFAAEIRDGFCWMYTQGYVVGMAAVREGDRTRFAHMEGFHFRGPRWMQFLLRPVARISRWRHGYHVPADVDGIERCLGLRPD